MAFLPRSTMARKFVGNSVRVVGFLGFYGTVVAFAVSDVKWDCEL